MVTPELGVNPRGFDLKERRGGEDLQLAYQASLTGAVVMMTQMKINKVG